MELADRKTIKRNMVSLSNDMDFKSVSVALLARDIFEKHHIQRYESKSSERDQNLALLMDIDTRGPRAFVSLIEALVEANQVNLAQLLGYPAGGNAPGQMGQAQASTPHHNIPGPFGQPTQQQAPQAWPPRDSSGDYSTTQMDALSSYPQSMVDNDNVYKMKSRPRGIALIINNKTFKTMKKRSGTDVDSRNLQNVFKQLGFNVVVHNDLKGREIQGMIDQLRRHNHTGFDCFIFAILTHGIEGAVYGTDEYLVKIEDIVSQFGSDRCPTLNGKPKLFFLQACRGERFDGGVEATDGIAVPASAAAGAGDNNQATAHVDSQLDDETLANLMIKMELDHTDSFASSRSKVPSQSDMLLAYATVPGFVSWRNSERGSWFIQALTEVFMQHARDEDLLSMITMINGKVARAFESSSGRHKQMPAPVVMLTKKLFFCPGHFD
ncbi:caspase-3-like [Lytechinus pictus]|uniref:caspase-3-like n=1 Tax=Lytechinus pictus TaxID=7653 RepID=UPI0030BA0550